MGLRINRPFQKMFLAQNAFILLLQFLLSIVVFSLPQKLVFLTLSSNGQNVSVSLVNDRADGRFLLENDGQTQQMDLLYNISTRENSNGSLSGELPQTKSMFVFGAQIGPTENGNGTLEYVLRENQMELANAKVDLLGGSSNLTVCIFGDYRADMMYAREINLSKYGDRERCKLFLFIGKISWEQRECPLCNSTSKNAAQIKSNFTKHSPDIGLTFSPFSMLDDNAGPGQVEAFAQIPSIFGQIGHNLNETTFFDCTEMNGVAFIQTTVEVSTVAKLGHHDAEQFQNVEHYFRETMLMELECKLQELHRRPKRPWILVYLTHPSLINEKETDILSLKDNDRFFDILNRYKIDLLLSCGVEGMAAILKERQSNKPAEELPPYLSTTMATCLSEKECQYLVLEIGQQEMEWRFMDGAGNRQKMGQFKKNTQNADECIPDEIPSITGAEKKEVKNGTLLS